MNNIIHDDRTPHGFRLFGRNDKIKEVDRREIIRELNYFREIIGDGLHVLTDDHDVCSYFDILTHRVAVAFLNYDDEVKTAYKATEKALNGLILRCRESGLLLNELAEFRAAVVGFFEEWFAFIDFITKVENDVASLPYSEIPCPDNFGYTVDVRLQRMKETFEALRRAVFLRSPTTAATSREPTAATSREPTAATSREPTAATSQEPAAATSQEKAKNRRGRPKGSKNVRPAGILSRKEQLEIVNNELLPALIAAGKAADCGCKLSLRQYDNWRKFGCGYDPEFFDWHKCREESVLRERIKLIIKTLGKSHAGKNDISLDMSCNDDEDTSLKDFIVDENAVDPGREVSRRNDGIPLSIGGHKGYWRMENKN